MSGCSQFFFLISVEEGGGGGPGMSTMGGSLGGREKGKV